MRITIGAVGRLRSGPEQDLIAHYQKALKATGPRAGITSLSFLEIDDRRSNKGAADLKSASDSLLKKLPQECFLIVLDETGHALESTVFAERLQTWSQNHRDVAFLIGGADGHSQSVQSQADYLLSLGPATWPHMLARAMLMEQIYRASTILAGHPYHRA